MVLVEPKDIPLGETVPLDDKTKLFNIFTDMIKMCEDQKGIGLSAVQVGLPYKMFVVKTPCCQTPIGVETKHFVVKDHDKYRCFLNCDYEPTTKAKRTLSLEGCLSLRSLDGRLRFFEVERWNQIKVSGTEFCLFTLNYILDFIEVVNTPLSIVFQHEIDHDCGKLISDLGKEVLIF